MLTVDRHDNAVAKVGAAVEVRCSDSGADAVCLGPCLWPVRVRDGVLAQDDFGIDSRLVDGPQHLGHHAAWWLARGAVPRDLDHHHDSWLGGAGPASRHQHIVAGAAVERHDVRLSEAIALEAADQVLERRLHGPGSARRRPTGKCVEMPADQHETPVFQQLP